METTVRPETASREIDDAVAALRTGAQAIVGWDLSKRIQIATACIATVAAASREWVEAACQAKRIPVGSKARAEELTGGPIATLRQLQLLIASFYQMEIYKEPMLPGRVRLEHGQLRCKIFPTRNLYDSLLFGPIRAETWLEPEVRQDNLFDPAMGGLLTPNNSAPETVCVLGAGNVSSIAATDTLSKILQENKSVLLKMNPVNEYLGPIFSKALKPLVDAGVLRIVYGGADVGTYSIHHPKIDEVHITGSAETHDAIVWGASEEERQENRRNGSPILTKRITSELGNVTPWAIIPGNYSKSQLKFQAENVAASITNNASFNCIATKLIVTSKAWPQRETFLSHVDEALRNTPARHAYYPGAAQRFERFSGLSAPSSDSLPWTVIRNIDPSTQEHLLKTESFVCVCGEVAMDARSPAEFLTRAVEFMNDQVWGTLAASLTVPTEMRDSDEVAEAIRELRYGTIAINQWSGLSFALVSPPWGAYAGSKLDDVQSGIGFVHNTYMLNHPQKTVLRSPLKFMPKPMWFASHRCPETVAWRLLELYGHPSVWRLPALLAPAVIG